MKLFLASSNPGKLREYRELAGDATLDLAPLPNLLALAHPLMEIGAVALFPKGAGVDQELTGAAAAWNMRVERFPSQTDKAGVILRLSEVTSA